MSELERGVKERGEEKEGGVGVWVLGGRGNGGGEGDKTG